MVRAQFPGSLKYRDLALRVVAAAANLVGERDRSFSDEVVSAFGEAFNNIAIHGYRDRPLGDVEVVIEHGGDWITIQLLDYGMSFDPSTVSLPNLDALPESGMGLFIIQSFMDELTYRPGTPNVLSMTKRHRPQAARRTG